MSRSRPQRPRKPGSTDARPGSAAPQNQDGPPESAGRTPTRPVQVRRSPLVRVREGRANRWTALAIAPRMVLIMTASASDSGSRPPRISWLAAWTIKQLRASSQKKGRSLRKTPCFWPRLIRGSVGQASGRSAGGLSAESRAVLKASETVELSLFLPLVKPFARLTFENRWGACRNIPHEEARALTR